MSKTITLNDIKITGIQLDYVGQVALVNYQILLSDGTVHQSDLALFYVTAPAPEATGFMNMPYVPKDHWYPMPAGGATQLTALANGTRSVLLALVS
jgi:hypothetical protein